MLAELHSMQVHAKCYSKLKYGEMLQETLAYPWDHSRWAMEDMLHVKYEQECWK
jgi:hypothetical protein